MSRLTFKISYQRHLPHIQPPGATLFVTYRLAGSLPSQVSEDLKIEVLKIQQEIDSIQDENQRIEIARRKQKQIFGRWDGALDSGTKGPLWLKQPEIADEVKKPLNYLDRKHYDLDTYCIMPNHVHVILTPLEESEASYHSMSKILHALKRTSARQANKVLSRSGQFWQHESYDHVIRDSAELIRVRRYILMNPVKAELADKPEDWPWSYCKFGIEF